MDYIIELDKFSGPLDLLLHLIKESNIDIFDINIKDITEQYLKYINKIEAMNLTVASEYLVMAAELIEMKSRILLPRNEVAELDEYEDDPREELIRRLIEYKNYKEITPELKELELRREEYYTKLPSLEINGVDLSPKVSEEIDMDALMKAFNEMLSRKDLEKPLNTKVTNKEYSVNKRCFEIREILTKRNKVKFEELFEDFSREYIVVTFLSVLTMAKNQEINIEQDNNFENFYILRK